MAPSRVYQLMIAADIFRGRYRENFATAMPITPDTPLLYRFALPTANHVFLPGHRIMVQIQSSWFPLYDRNPQTFVPNIFWAKPGDYRKATQRIYHSPNQSSFIDLPLAAPVASARAAALETHLCWFPTTHDDARRGLGMFRRDFRRGTADLKRLVAD
jgi:X-Pro dipeptidyl-peptidase C-terminal non-catalytic domain